MTFEQLTIHVALALAENEGDAKNGKFYGHAIEWLWIERAEVAMSALDKLDILHRVEREQEA